MSQAFNPVCKERILTKFDCSGHELVSKLETMNWDTHVVRFGTNEKTNSLDGVQISKISTFGGFQFRVNQVNRIGQLSASFYTPYAIDAVIIALKYADKYLEPIENEKIRAVLFKHIGKRDFAWYSCIKLPGYNN